jgi:hypothetical protein
MNLYGYVANDPVNMTDPSGECPWCIGAISSVVLGAAIRGVTGGDIFDAEAIAIDAATGAIGAGFANKIGKLAQLARMPSSGIGKSAVLGRIGEKAAGTSGKKTAVTIGGKVRVPDQVTSSAVIEVKNVASVSAREAAQISDSVALAQGTGKEAVLLTRPGADVSRVQGLIDNRSLTHGTIPGIGSDGLRQLGTSGSAAAGATVGTATNCVRGQPLCN